MSLGRRTFPVSARAMATGLLTLAVLMSVSLAGPPVATAQHRDCSDFDSQAEAQDFYERAGPGDPHRLDADDDGRACDANPCPCRGPGEDGGGDPGGEPQRRFQTIRSRVIRVIDGDTIVIRPL